MLLAGGTCRGQPTPVQQCRARITECAEYHGPGTEKIRGVASDVEAEQGHHAGEADDQAEGASAVRNPGSDQPQREHGREQRVGRGEKFRLPRN